MCMYTSLLLVAILLGLCFCRKEVSLEKLEGPLIPYHWHTTGIPLRHGHRSAQAELQETGFL